MTPPSKRRKLSDPGPAGELYVLEQEAPAPFAHVVESLDAFTTGALPSPSAQPVDTDRSAHNLAAAWPLHHHGLHRQRDVPLVDDSGDLVSGLESTVTAIVYSVVATATVTAAAVSILESAASAISDTGSTLLSAAGVASASAESTSTPTPATNSPTHLAASPSPGTNSSSLLGTGSAATRTSAASQSTLGSSANATAPILYTVRLSNGTIETLTESRFAYTTTLKDGEAFTIPGFLSNTPPSATGDISAADATTVFGVLVSPTNSASSDSGVAAGPASSTTSDAAASTGVVTTSDSAAAPTAPPGTIAGGVVGGAAGLAVIVFVAMVFLRWYRSRSAASRRYLPAASRHTQHTQDHPPQSRRPGMAERAGLMPLVAGVPALFRHTTSTSGTEHSFTDASQPSERGFTRISGRKLPSQFSPGMSSDDPLPSSDHLLPMGIGGAAAGSYRTTSASSPSLVSTTAGLSSYHNSTMYSQSQPRNPFDDHDTAGLYSDDSEHLYSPQGAAHGSAGYPETMTMSPGPRRQPLVHRAGPYSITPQGSEAKFANVSLTDDDAPDVRQVSRRDYAVGAGLGVSPGHLHASSHLLARNSATSSRYTDDMSSTDRLSVVPDRSAPTPSTLGRSSSARNSRFTEEM